jgi:NodT family efflux transporter outer membrane factor (OMF) lipoprotein
VNATTSPSHSSRHSWRTSLCAPASISRVALLLGLACLAACGSISGPEYEAPPETPEKASWSSAPASLSAAETIRTDWWQEFHDPYPNQLIEQALSSNQDLKVLAARTSVAEAAIGQANAARLPTVDAALGGSFQRSSTPSGSISSSQTSYSTAVGWELDIWGKLKKGVKAQEASVRASEADWRAGYLTLASDVSTTYFRIRQFDEQIDQQDWSLETSEDILAIFRLHEQEGMVPATQVMQQEAEVSRLRTDLLELQRLRQLAANALGTLLGVPAGELHVPKQHLSDTVKTIDVPAGLPSDLLNRRPDIVAAQYRILQAYELEGQSSLARLPSISLTSSLGGTSNELSSLLNGWTALLRPSLSIPIFNPGVNAQYRVSQAESELIEQEYRAVVIRAYEEVENALVNLSNRGRQHEQLLASRDKLDIVSIQVKARLKEGMVTQLEVFESERSLLAAKQRLLANHQLILSDTVELYKALGGGWPPADIGALRAPMSQTKALALVVAPPSRAQNDGSST